MRVDLRNYSACPLCQSSYLESETTTIGAVVACRSCEATGSASTSLAKIGVTCMDSRIIASKLYEAIESALLLERCNEDGCEQEKGHGGNHFAERPSLPGGRRVFDEWGDRVVPIRHVANFRLSDTCAVCGNFPEDCKGSQQ